LFAYISGRQTLTWKSTPRSGSFTAMPGGQTALETD